MKKILSIIGTRPQYIKIKPIYDALKGDAVLEHILVDTCQHFSKNVSDCFIEEFGLDIFRKLNIDNKSELSFIADSITKIGELLKKSEPDLILVYGDTNSTFAAALCAYKLSIPIGHVEAGVRGFTKIPEETNRVYVDQVSDIHFCSNRSDTKNVSNGIHSGDLEYELLNNINPNISFQDFGVMTIHRQSNMNVAKINKIFERLSHIQMPINFYIHHRTDNFINSNSNEIIIPKNIKILPPCNYALMVESLSACKLVITDSGSIHKTLPFFGKRGLIFRDEGIEWKEVDEAGFSKKYENERDIAWLLDRPPDRNKRFLIGQKTPSEIIIEKIKEILIK